VIFSFSLERSTWREITTTSSHISKECGNSIQHPGAYAPSTKTNPILKYLIFLTKTIYMYISRIYVCSLSFMKK
jgi:hypothetical protein